jgi:hypothetical protein
MCALREIPLASVRHFTEMCGRSLSRSGIDPAPGCHILSTIHDSCAGSAIFNAPLDRVDGPRSARDGREPFPVSMVAAMKNLGISCTSSDLDSFPVARLDLHIARLATFATLAWLLSGVGVMSGVHARTPVAFPESYPAGTIIIKEAERRLYYTTGWGTAISYPIAVGKAGQEWYGEAYVSGKYLSPAWRPPAVVRQDHPGFPVMIPGGSPRNPMGAAAITLNRDEVAIHGTTRGMRRSVGTAASYGCIRMYNEDVLDLFRRVHVGTRVVAVP